MIPQKIIDKVTAFRHLLHRNAELSLHEKKTLELLESELSKIQSLEVTNIGKWILAVYHADNQSKEPIAFRADFDALPIEETIDKPWASADHNVSHRCGHDGHSAILYGLALLLDMFGADRDVYLIFQHAEEIGAGAAECVEALKTYPISQVYAFHNWSGFEEGCILIRKGTSQLASKGVTYSFTGKESHASQPEDGNNPTQAIAEFLLGIEEILHSTAFSGPAFATVVNVLVGSKNFGINPGYGEVSATLRAETAEDMLTLETKIKHMAEDLSRKFNLIFDISETDVFPETANTDKAVENVVSAAESSGLKIRMLEKPFRSSEDFGWFTKAFGGAIFYIGNGIDYPQIHTTEYDFNDRIIPVALEIFHSILQL